jgi:4-hydroxy-3-methylbut-2-en-1-yl diphosphate reductase
MAGVRTDVDKVLLADPRGFCAGVEMAIKALAWMVRVFETPVYCYHEIVHNQLVVDRFRDLGVIFVDDVNEVPEGAPLMLSAHGSAPEVVAAARGARRFVVDAVCPLVTKVHHEAKVRAEKCFSIVYVGHAGHDEAAGTLAVAPEAMHLVEDESGLDEVLEAIEDRERVAVLAQTTLAVGDWQGVVQRSRERFPDLWTAARNDLCFATTNRQAALTAIAGRAEAVVVIGSANSSNTLALTKVARFASTAPRSSTSRHSQELGSSASPPVRVHLRISSRRSSQSSIHASVSRTYRSPRRTSISLHRASCANSSPRSTTSLRSCSVTIHPSDPERSSTTDRSTPPLCSRGSRTAIEGSPACYDTCPSDSVKAACSSRRSASVSSLTSRRRTRPSCAGGAIG